MCNFDDVDIKRKEFMDTQKIYKDSNTNSRSVDISEEGALDDCPNYVKCDPAPIKFSCIVTIPPGYKLASIDEGGNTTITKDCTYLYKSLIKNSNSKIAIPDDCNCSDCSLSYPVKIRQIKVKGAVQIKLYTFISGRPLGEDGNPSVHHPYDDTSVVCGQATVCVDSTIAYSTVNCIPDIDYGLVAYFQNAEEICNSLDEKIARLNGNLYVYILPETI